MATVSETTRSTRITLGSLSAGPFNVGFRIFSPNGVKVYVNGEVSTDWTLTATFANGYSDTATITFGAALPAATVIQIDGSLIPGRADDYVNPDPGLTEKINIELARIWAAISENRMLALRSVRSLEEIPATDGVSGVNFAEAADAAVETLAARDQVLAVEAMLPDWQGAWLTGTVYSFGHLVRQNGSTYFCVVPHTSGTFNTDLAAMRWEMFAQKGDAGAGIGDVVAANAGSEFSAVAATFRTNLGLAIGTHVQAYNQLLGAISGLATPGLMVRLTGSTAVARTITGTANQLTVTNGDGVSGNPTIAAVIASQVEAEAGVNTTKLMTAQRVAQAIAALASRGRVLLQAGTALADPQLDITAFDNAVYSYYEIELANLKPTTDATVLWLRLSTDAGATYDAGASDYQYALTGVAVGGVAGSDTSAGTTRIGLTFAGGVGNAAGERGVTGTIKLFGVWDPAVQTRVKFDTQYDNPSGALVTVRGDGVRRADQDTTAARLLFSSGTIASGSYRLYGIRP